MFKIIKTDPFYEKMIRIFDKEELDKFSKFRERLRENPYLGDGLRTKYVREFKTKQGKRAYFIVYEEINSKGMDEKDETDDLEAVELVDKSLQALKEGRFSEF